MSTYRIPTDTGSKTYYRTLEGKVNSINYPSPGVPQPGLEPEVMSVKPFKAVE